MSGEKVKPNPLKAELRVDVDARLAAMTDADRERQSKVVLNKIFAHPKYKSAKRISLFMSLPTEVPTEPILHDILARGHAAFVPQYSRGQMRMLRVLPGEIPNLYLIMSLPTEVPTEPILHDILARGDSAFVPQYSRGQMRMLRVLPGDLGLMVETSWKIKQHKKDADREDPMENGGLDLVIAPGAAFTRDGWRCGHGGGYYDRYLTALLTRHQADPSFRNPYIMAVGFNQQIYPSIPVDIQDVRVDEVLTAE